MHQVIPDRTPAPRRRKIEGNKALCSMTKPGRNLSVETVTLLSGS